MEAKNPDHVENGKSEKDRIVVRDFDELFKHIGGIGPYQLCHMAFIGLMGFLFQDSIYINFFGAETEHWCRVPELEKLPFKMQKYISIPDSDPDSSFTHSTCEMYDLNYTGYDIQNYIQWNRTLVDGSTRRINCNSGWVHDRSLFVSTVVQRWDLVCDDSWLVELLSTIIIAGIGVGAVLSGELSDRFGRRTTLVLLSIVKVGAGYLCVWAPNYELMAVGRFLVGLGGNGSYIAAFVLRVEITDPRWRAFFSGVGSVTTALGYMVVPGIAYAIRDYQWMLLIPPTLALIPLIYWWVLPESARWLVSQGRRAEAEKTLRRIAEINGREWPENIDLEPLYTINEVKSVEKTGKIRGRSPLDLFRNRMMLKLTLNMGFLWFSVSLIYYALSLNSGTLAGDLFLNTFLLGAVEIPANLLNLFLLTKGYVGRRVLICTTMLAAGITSFISIPLIIDGSQDTLTVVLAILGKGSATMAFSLAYIYSSEVFPTEHRNTGIGVVSLCARISGMAAPYVGGMLIDVWEPLPFLIYGIFGTGAGLLALLLPETQGLQLPQTVEDAEVLFSRSKKKGQKGEQGTTNNSYEEDTTESSHL